MKKIKIFLLSLASSMGAFAADIDIAPGELADKLAEATKAQIELKLRGAIDARDLAALESLSSDIKTLDLSEVRIEALTMPSRKYFGRTLFKEGEIPAYTFFKLPVETLVLPAEVSSIGEGAFAGSDITEIVIPEGVTEIGDYAFYGCPRLRVVTFPSSLVSIGKGAFGNCMALESLDLSATGISAVPERAFAGSMSLESVKLPGSVAKIGREAFSHTSIRSLNLVTVAEFEAYALSSMPFLTELSINPDAEISDGLLMDDTSLASLTGMPEMVPDYFAANCGKLDTKTAVDGAVSLGRYSFANTLAPEVLVLPAFLTKIDRGALSGLATITKIDATALENRIPPADEHTFEGLDQKNIVLWVDDTAFDAWEGDPVWSLFQVMSQNQTEVEEIRIDDTSAIAISLRSSLLMVESPAIVTDVRIYTSDGRIAYVASPDSESVEIDTASLPSGVLIVTASDSEGNTGTASLLLK